MYCRNCMCTGCSIVPELAKIRRAYRDAKKRTRDIETTIQASQHTLTGWTDWHRADLQRRLNDLTAKISAVMRGTLIDLVTSAKSEMEAAQSTLNDLREKSDPEHALTQLAEDATTDQTKVTRALDVIRHHRALLSQAESNLTSAKKKYDWQVSELAKYKSAEQTYQSVKGQLETFDQRRTDLQAKLTASTEELQRQRQEVACLDQTIREKVRLIRKFHSTDRTTPAN